MPTNSRIDEIIDNLILVWSGIPSYAPLAQVLLEDREILANLSFPASGKGPLAADEIRSRLLCHALERVRAGIASTHFVLFKEAETVQVVLEDSFGVNPGIEQDEIIVPHQKEAIAIIVKCLFGKRFGPTTQKDIAAFMQLFSRIGQRGKLDQDRIMRYKSILWLVYMAIDFFHNDKETCGKGPDFALMKFRQLLEHTINGDIIDEESGRPGLEGGKWERTLFGWLQGEDRGEFVLKLKRQFNFENQMEHANRYLLAWHRKRVFEETMALFC